MKLFASTFLTGLTALCSLTATAETDMVKNSVLAHPMDVATTIEKVPATDVNCPCYYLDVSYTAFYRNGIEQVFAFRDGKELDTLNIVAETNQTEEIGSASGVFRFGPYQNGTQAKIFIAKEGTSFGAATKVELGKK